MMFIQCSHGFIFPSKIEAMVTHETLIKNFFESNLKKKKGQHSFPDTFDFGLKCDE